MKIMEIPILSDSAEPAHDPRQSGGQMDEISQSRYILTVPLLPKLAVSAIFSISICLLQGAYGDTTDFEIGSGYNLGADISTVPVWKASAAGVGSISNEQAHSGAQSLKIPASNASAAVSQNFKVPKDGIVFIDFWIKPNADTSTTPLSTVNAGGAVLGFMSESGQGTVVAVTNPTTGTSASTGYTFGLDDQNLANSWIHVTIREDSSAGTWDLFLDGQLTLIDQPLAAPVKGKSADLSFYPDSGGPAFIDDLLIAGSNPLFADVNKDGIPDAVETANGLDLSVNDRNMLLSSGISMIQQFLNLSRGNSPTLSRLGSFAANSRPIIYVDNSVGNDSNTGEFSYGVPGRGPKASLLSAIRSGGSSTGATIALVPTTQIYQIPQSALQSPGSINLLPLGDVSITSTGN